MDEGNKEKEIGEAGILEFPVNPRKTPKEISEEVNRRIETLRLLTIKRIETLLADQSFTKSLPLRFFLEQFRTRNTATLTRGVVETGYVEKQREKDHTTPWKSNLGQNISNWNQPISPLTRAKIEIDTHWIFNTGNYRNDTFTLKDNRIRVETSSQKAEQLHEEVNEAINEIEDPSTNTLLQTLHEQYLGVDINELQKHYDGDLNELINHANKLLQREELPFRIELRYNLVLIVPADDLEDIIILNNEKTREQIFRSLGKIKISDFEKTLDHKQEIAALKRRIEEAEYRIALKDGDLKRLNEKLGKKDAEIARLEGELKKANETIAKLEKRMIDESVRTIPTGLVAKINSLKDQFSHQTVFLIARVLAAAAITDKPQLRVGEIRTLIPGSLGKETISRLLRKLKEDLIRIEENFGALGFKLKTLRPRGELTEEELARKRVYRFDLTNTTDSVREAAPAPKPTPKPPEPPDPKLPKKPAPPPPARPEHTMRSSAELRDMAIGKLGTPAEQAAKRRTDQRKAKEAALKAKIFGEQIKNHVIDATAIDDGKPKTIAKLKDDHPISEIATTGSNIDELRRVLPLVARCLVENNTITVERLEEYHTALTQIPNRPRALNDYITVIERIVKAAKRPGAEIKTLTPQSVQQVLRVIF